MTTLAIPDSFSVPGLIADVADADTMFNGDSRHYLAVGLSALGVIEAALCDARPPRRILDLPCGFGRVTRMLRARYPSADITVCDLDRAGVDFTAACFGARGVYSEQDFRDLQLGATFDLIWVGSLLTHLPEHQARQFLDFAVRHMTPHSRLIVTTHGDYVSGRLREWTYGLTTAAARGLLAEFRMTGYGFRGYAGGQHYGISLAARSWFEHLLAGSPLCLQSYQERGWDDHQDTLLLRRRRPAASWKNAFDRLRRRRRPTPAWFDQSGMAAVPSPAAEPARAAERARLDETTVRGFDEAWYLARFADVASAVDAGLYASGLSHYMQYGWAEGRPFCDQALTFNSLKQPTRAAYCTGSAEPGAHPGG